VEMFVYAADHLSI